MKIVVIKTEVDQFDKAMQVLERELTPQERTWLILADVLLKRPGKSQPARKGLKAA
jgi:hypothetical protein